MTAYLSSIFSPVDFLTLFKADYESVNDLISSQNEDVKERHFASSRDNRPPEIRIKEVDSKGIALIHFTNEIDFPDNLADLINEQKDAFYTALNVTDQDFYKSYLNTTEKTP